MVPPDLGPAIASLELSQQDFNACFDLVRGIRHLYLVSGMGWSSADKRDEMRYVDGMQYLILRHTDGTISAFASFVPDDDGDELDTPVTYLYELHVHPSHRGRGLARQLVAEVQRRAQHLHQPVMLTVFNANGPARQLYARVGFVQHGPQLGPQHRRATRSSSGTPAPELGWHQLVWTPDKPLAA